jgi:NAD(P)-dependent dehydrogenase (short-subunit alcohol dehydrogenase family)
MWLTHQPRYVRLKGCPCAHFNAALQAVKRELASVTRDVLVLPLDLTGDAAGLEAAAAAADRAFDGAGIDYLVHNAGKARRRVFQGLCLLRAL